MRPKILILDPLPKGHQNFYLSLILNSFSDCRLELLTTAGNLELRDHMARRNVEALTYVIIPPDETKTESVLKQAADLVRTGKHDLVFIPYLDSFLETLLSRFSTFPCPVSGIWFHPYPLDKKYGWLPPLDKRLKHRGLIHRALKKRTPGITFSHIHFLHPDSPRLLNRLNPLIASSVLVDPWERLPSLSKDEARKRFGLPDDRLIFLHIGSTERRKGLAESVCAFESLSGDVTINRKIFLLRVGPIDSLSPEDQKRFDVLVSSGMAGIIPKRVPEADFMEYFAASDCVLIPYRKFRFSSGVLSNSIAAGKPVIATGAGLLGDTVRDEQLGITIASPSPKDLSRAIRIVANRDFSFQIDRNSIAKRNPDHFTVRQSLSDKSFRENIGFTKDAS